MNDTLDDQKGRTKFMEYDGQVKFSTGKVYKTYDEFRDGLKYRIMSHIQFKENSDQYLTHLLVNLIYEEFKSEFESKYQEDYDFYILEADAEEDLKNIETEFAYNMNELSDTINEITEKIIVFEAIGDRSIPEPTPIEEEQIEREQQLNYCAQCNIQGNWLQCPSCLRIPQEKLVTFSHNEQLARGAYTLSSNQLDERITKLTNPQAYPKLTSSLEGNSNKLKVLRNYLIEISRPSFSEIDFDENIGYFKLLVAKKIVDLEIKNMKNGIIGRIGKPVSSLLTSYVGKNPYRVKGRRTKINPQTEITKYYDAKLKELEKMSEDS